MRTRIKAATSCIKRRFIFRPSPSFMMCSRRRQRQTSERMNEGRARPFEAKSGRRSLFIRSCSPLSFSLSFATHHRPSAREQARMKVRRRQYAIMPARGRNGTKRTGTCYFLIGISTPLGGRGVDVCLPRPSITLIKSTLSKKHLPLGLST